MSKIREATERDFEGICNLIQSKEELFLVYPNGKYPFTIDQIIELAQVRKELSVLIEDKKIIGFANFYNYEPLKSVFIGNVVIDGNYRSRGMGKEIISYMLKVAYEKHNLPEVRISVFNENSKALLLYSGLGFSPYEIEEKKNIQGERAALMHMRRLRVYK